MKVTWTERERLVYQDKLRILLLREIVFMSAPDLFLPALGDKHQDQDLFRYPAPPSPHPPKTWRVMWTTLKQKVMSTLSHLSMILPSSPPPPQQYHLFLPQILHLLLLTPPLQMTQALTHFLVFQYLKHLHSFHLKIYLVLFMSHSAHLLKNQPHPVQLT